MLECSFRDSSIPCRITFHRLVDFNSAELMWKIALALADYRSLGNSVKHSSYPSALCKMIGNMMH